MTKKRIYKRSAFFVYSPISGCILLPNLTDHVARKFCKDRAFLRTFETVDDYLSDTFVQSDLKAKRKDLIKYAILVGEFSNFSVTKEGKKFIKTWV